MTILLLCNQSSFGIPVNLVVYGVVSVHLVVPSQVDQIHSSFKTQMGYV